MNSETIRLKCPRCGHRIPVTVAETTQRLACPQCRLPFDLRFSDRTPLIRVATGELDSAGARARASSDAQSKPSHPATHEYIRVKHWQEQRGHVLSSVEEKLHVVGLLFAVISITCAIFPLFAAPLGMEAKPLFLISMWGLIAITIAAILLLYTLRRHQARALISVGLLVLIGGGLNFLTARTYYDEVVASRVGESNDDSQPAETQPLSGRRVAQNPLQNPAAQYVPPRLRDPENDSQSHPSPFVDVDNPRDTTSEAQDTGVVASDGELESEEEFRPDRVRSDIDLEKLEQRVRGNPFGGEDGASDAPFSVKPTLPSGKYGAHEKRQRLAERTARMYQTRVSRSRVSDVNFKNRFALTKPVGKATVLGRAYYTNLAARGLDAVKSERDPSAIAAVIPFYEDAEFADSLYQSGNYFLAGINAHFRDDKLVGIQAILAPVRDDRLDMQRVVNSVWFGEAGRGSRVKTLTSPDGHPVYGIVVYEEKLRISGLALIVDRETFDE